MNPQFFRLVGSCFSTRSDAKTIENWGSRLQPQIKAGLYAMLGEKDQAFEWLERAYEARGGIIVYPNVASYRDPLRDDPRFHDLLLRMNLDP